MNQPTVLYRYIRPLVYDGSNVILPTYNQFGGITFRIEINNKELICSYAKCSSETYFNTKLAKYQVNKKFKLNQVFKINYNSNISIIDNILLELSCTNIVDLKNLHKLMLFFIKQNNQIKEQFKLNVPHLNPQTLYF